MTADLTLPALEGKAPAELQKQLAAATDDERLFLLIALGWVMATVDVDMADQYTRQAQQLAELHKREDILAHAARNKARCLFYRSQYVQALMMLDEAERLYVNVIGETESGMLDLMRAESLYRIADYHKAQEAAERAIDASETAPNGRVFTSALSVMGAVATMHQNYTLALQCFERCIPIYEARQFTRGLGKAHNNLGKVYLAMGRYEDALRVGEHALSYYRACGDRRGEMFTQSWHGDIYHAQGDLDAAAHTYTTVLEWAEVLKDYPVILDMHYKLATLLQQQGKYSEAIKAYHHTLQLAEQHQQTYTLRDTHRDLAACYEHIQDYRAALYHLRQYQVLQQAFSSADTAEKLQRFQDKSDLKLARQEAEIMRLKVLEAQRQLEHADRLSAVGKISSGIAHEINNPLQAIYGNLLLLQEEDMLSPKVADYLQMCVEQIERIIRLTASMREMYQFGIHDDAVTDLSDIVQKVLLLMQKTIDSHRVVLVTHLATALPPLFASSTQIQQVIINLILNAIEAMPTGGTLTLITRYQPHDERLVLEVNDTGLGIAPEHLARVFDPFFTTRHEGSGLGLAICQNIVKYYGGEILINSIYGKYTHVCVKFCRADSQ